MRKVLEYTYFVEAEFNKNKSMIYMNVYERRETGNTFVLPSSSISYTRGLDDVDTLINKWTMTLSNSTACSMWFVPVKEGFKEELKRLLKESEELEHD